jgi:hypothetical protein
MRAPACVRVLAVVAAAAAAAGCNYPYGSSSYDYGPSFQRAPGYQPGYTSAYETQWANYRNYRGAVKPLPEKIQ